MTRNIQLGNALNRLERVDRRCLKRYRRRAGLRV
jgi:hypothetical protein